MKRYSREYLDSLSDIEDFKTTEEAKTSAWTFVQAIKEDKFQFTPSYNGGVQIDVEVRSPCESCYTEVEWDCDGDQVLD